MIIHYFYYYLFPSILNMRRNTSFKMHFTACKMQHIIFIL
jgi:hypothetical protein